MSEALSERRLADVGAEAVLIAGGGCAILLQLANPAIGHAIARHSDFVTDPLRRLRNTLTYVYADSTVVLGPLASKAEPHSYDLCARHAERMSAPQGWQIMRYVVMGEVGSEA